MSWLTEKKMFYLKILARKLNFCIHYFFKFSIKFHNNNIGIHENGHRNWKVCRRKKLHRCFCSILTIAVMLQHISQKIYWGYTNYNLNFSEEQNCYFLSIFYLQVLVEGDIECLVETNTMEQIHEPIKLYWNYWWVGYSK